MQTITESSPFWQNVRLLQLHCEKGKTDRIDWRRTEITLN